MREGGWRPGGTHTILLKFAKGVPFSPADGGLRGGGRTEGRPWAKPAAFAPDLKPTPKPTPSISLSLKAGRPRRRLARPLAPIPGVEAVEIGKGGLSARCIRMKPFTVASTVWVWVWVALSRERLRTWGEKEVVIRVCTSDLRIRRVRIGWERRSGEQGSE